MTACCKIGEPAGLLRDYAHLFTADGTRGPVLDLACGRGDNGLFLAQLGVPVVLVDRSRESLDVAEKRAREADLRVTLRQVDLESEESNPLENRTFRGILVFRYLHRPLIPCIQEALHPGGTLIYETFTRDQAGFGRPTNPDFLLRRGELFGWFKGWDIIHYSEGLKDEPLRAVAQLVCKKPA